MGDEPTARATRVAETPGHVRTMPIPETQSMDRALSHPFLLLQQTIGNRAVQRLIQNCPAFPGACPTGGACHTCPVRTQAKLDINQPGDAHEQEADRVAERVMAMPEPRLQRQDSHPPAIAARTGPGTIQRELAAYKSASVTKSTYKSKEGNYEHITTLSGDAGTLMGMLQALIDAKKVGLIDSGDALRFFNRGASSTEVEEALKTHPRGKDLAKYLMDNNNTYFYSRERVFQQNTPFGSFADKTSDYTAQHTTRTTTLYNAQLHMESGRFVGNNPNPANNLREEVLQAMDRLIQLGAYATSVDYFSERNAVNALAAGSRVAVNDIPGTIAAIRNNETMTLDKLAATYLGLALSASVGQGQTNNRDDIKRLQDLLHTNWHITNSDYNTERAAVDALTTATVSDAIIPKTIEGIKKIRVSYAAGTFNAAFLRQLETSAEAGRMVGSSMTWTPSGPGSGTHFEQWASAASQGATPALSSTTVMNCWEMVFFSAFRAGQVTWQWIHDTYTTGPTGSAWFNWLPGRMTRGTRLTYTVGDANSPAPQRGQIVFFNGSDHVAIAQGTRDGTGKTQVISFWPGIVGAIDQVRETTIEDLVNFMGGPVTVTFASPAW